MTSKEKQIIKMIKGINTEKLVELWNHTEKQEMSAEVARVRGWIMEALESKNKVAFDNWIDAGNEPEAHFA